MKKDLLIEKILNDSNIHHNISINFSKLVDYTNQDIENGFSWEERAEIMIEFFKTDFEDISLTPQNDCGNRNLGEDCELKGKIWSGGRGGATLYWDAYWNEGGVFRYDVADLLEKDHDELRMIESDMVFFANQVENLMASFYSQCSEDIEMVRKDAKENARVEVLYNRTLGMVKKNDFIKRLVSDLL